MSVRTNRDVVVWLLSREPEGLLPAPSIILADWVETMPDRPLRRKLRAVLRERFDVELAPPSSEPIMGWKDWLAATFEPPVYCTDDDTGERERLSHAFALESGLLETRPQKLYRMPADLSSEDLGKWMLGEPPYDDREAYAQWLDSEGHQYVMIDGKLLLKKGH